jgi:YidC/Oxa1 family membrane protein insertase
MDLLDIIGWVWTHGLVIPMTNFMVLLARLSFGNFGLAVIIFTLLTRAITWPLTRQQLQASKQMQALQPKIQALQKQHKDPRRRSEETMKLYKEAGVSPLDCIWPMLVQFPIWIALYQSIQFTLGATPENLIDLSQRLYPWSFLRTAVPLDKQFLWLDLGKPDSTLLMAVLVGASAWVQQKMMTPVSASTDPQQQQMNQTMLIMMPLIFAMFTLQFPSGLALYWLATNVVSIVLQYFYMGRQFDLKQLFTIAPAPAPAVKKPAPEPAAKEAAAEAKNDEAEPVGAETERRRRRRRRGRRRR